MVRIINYIRSWFCKHEFDYSEGRMYSWRYYSATTRAHLACRKCGYVKSWWKGD